MCNRPNAIPVQGDTEKEHSDHAYSKSQSHSLKDTVTKTKKQNSVSNVYTPLIETISKLATAHNPKELSFEEKATIVQSFTENSNTDEISKTIMSIGSLKSSIHAFIRKETNDNSNLLKNRKLGFVSVLMSKGPEKMSSASWDNIGSEFVTLFPDLANLLLSVMLKPEDRYSFRKIQHILPKLAFMYGLMLQTRNHELSLVQRLLSLVLFDNICDQKVIFFV